MLMVWLIGWAFTAGVTLDDDASLIAVIKLLIYWPLTLGQYVRSKSE